MKNYIKNTKYGDISFFQTNICHIVFPAALCWPCLLTPPWTIFHGVHGIILTLAVSVFRVKTWWIPNMALSYQATVYTPLLGYNFLCVMMFNSKWLHGSLPNLTTVSRACRAWCVSGGVEAIFGCYVPIKEMTSRSGLDISLRLENIGLGQRVFLCRGRRVVDAQKTLSLSTESHCSAKAVVCAKKVLHKDNFL